MESRHLGGEHSQSSALSRIAALGDESIYDGPSRLAQPDEAWNYGTGDGLEKCLLAANILGGTEIRVARGTATLMDGERAVCSFPTAKRPRETTWPLTCRRCQGRAATPGSGSAG